MIRANPIISEFNPSLALRESGTKGRLEEECVPAKLRPGVKYEFLKSGQRNYWIEGEVPLVITKGNQEISRPIASIMILEVKHFLNKGQTYTRGRYEVCEVYDPNDPTIHFEGMEKVK